MFKSTSRNVRVIAPIDPTGYWANGGVVAMGTGSGGQAGHFRRDRPSQR